MSAHPTGNPVRMGRRVWARVIDSTIAVALSLGAQIGAVAAVMGGSTGLLLGCFAALLAWAGFASWTVFARAALPGQWLLGLHHVDAATGARAGARTFLKYLAQGCTFGLALLITPMTIQAPNRSWFDRLCGVILVDAKEPDPAGSTRAQVISPPAGWESEESQLTQLGHASPAAGNAMIQSVPFDAPRSQALQAQPPAVERPAPVVVTPGVASAPISSAVRVPIVTLDSGETVPLTGTLIVGRAPRQSANFGESTLVVVADRSVSANHVVLGLEPSGPWVMDLNSTNGSWVEQDGDAASRLDPMSKLPLSPDAVVKIGQRRFTVTAR